MMGPPPGMLGGRPGVHLVGQGIGPRGMDADMRPPSVCQPGTMMGGGGGACGMRRPADVMHPPIGPSSASDAVTGPTSTTSELLSGRSGGMVGNMATTSGSSILGLSQPTKPEDQRAPDEMVAPPTSGPSMTSKTEPLPPPKMMDEEEERALLQGRATLPPPTTAERPPRSTERPAAPELTRKEPSFHAWDRDEHRDHGGEAAAGGDREACTACRAGGLEFCCGKKCPHAFCVSCVQSYFSHGETECPVCGVKDDVTGRTLTQPASGHMLTTFENSFKLPGFETTSRGTIIVTYSFPAGIQTV